jgi:hypothetical protein
MEGWVPVSRKGDTLIDPTGKEYKLIGGQNILDACKYYHGSNVYERKVTDDKEYIREVPADSQLAKWLTWGV